MGAACCVAAKDKPRPHRKRGETIYRHVHSPPWSFQWENRGRVAGETVNPSNQSSHQISRNISFQQKESSCPERGNHSYVGSPQVFGSPASLKSSDRDVSLVNQAPLSDVPVIGNCSGEVNSEDSLEIRDSKLALTIPSSFSTPSDDRPSIHPHPLPPYLTPSRRACRSPGHHLLRHISDSRILGLKSPNNNSLSEGRSSFVLSTNSNDFGAGSHGGSSDGWSVRTFSELVASSQRGRWSFDSEHLDFGYDKISASSSRFSYSPSVDMKVCGACSKLLTERSAWSSQRLFAGNELPSVAVLVCGHVFHADCLETMTTEVDKYDPTCPLCVVEENQSSKMSRKDLKAESVSRARHHRRSRNRVVDSYIDGGCDALNKQKNSDRVKPDPKVECSSSSGSSIAKPFLRRHFPFGSKRRKTISDNTSPRNKGFWTRRHNDKVPVK